MIDAPDTAALDAFAQAAALGPAGAGVDGGTVPGRELIDRFWGGLVQWATVDQPPLIVEQQRVLLHERVMAHPDGAHIWETFEAGGYLEPGGTDPVLTRHGLLEVDRLLPSFFEDSAPAAGAKAAASP